MTACSNGHSVPQGSLWCGACGEDLRVRCGNGHPAAADDSFCPECGLAVSAPAEDNSTPLLMSPATAPANLADQPSQAPPAMPPPPSAQPSQPQYPPPGHPLYPPPGHPLYPPPGEPQYPPPGQPQFAPPQPMGTLPAYSFDLKRLNTIDRVTSVSAVVLLLSLFLPWFGIAGVSFHRNGINAHSYLFLVFLTSLALIAYEAARAGWDRLPFRLPVAHAPLLLVIGVVQLLLVLIGFLFGHAGWNLAFGAWLALFAALGACLPVAVPAVRAFRQAQ